MASSSTNAGAPLSSVDAGKRASGFAAVDAHVKPEHRLIGIGSGSTVPFVVERLIEQGAEVNRERWFIPTGFQSKKLIVDGGLRLGDIDVFPQLDVTIDGADEVDNALNLIKGGGACHLREKVIAAAAREFIVVADDRKRSNVLGTTWKQGIPVEVAPFAAMQALATLKRMGSTEAQLRMGGGKAGPVVTDNGNFVIDAPFNESYMRDPKLLAMQIKQVIGVVEVGLFTDMAKTAYFGHEDGTVTVQHADGSSHKGTKPT